MNTLHFCTVFDKNYLTKGLCLRYSLREQLISNVAIERPFVLHVLCLDQETFEILKELQYPTIQLYQLWALEAVYKELQTAKELPASKYGSQGDNYIWRLTPFFINHLLHSGVIKPNQFLMYVDSDIYFYKSPAIIVDYVKFSGKSMGIHTHRFTGPFQNTTEVGWFNVGVMLFKNNDTGRRLAGWWKKLCMTNDHHRYDFYGTCGDQKYIDLLYEAEKEHICVFDEEGDIYHLAPWNSWLDKELFFYHFSHFVPDFEGNNWKDHYNEKPEWNPSTDQRIYNLYALYNQRNALAYKQISSIQP